MTRARGSDVAPIVHVGLHKTATTMLQRQVFPQLPSVRVLSKQEHRSLIDRLVGPHDLGFDPDPVRQLLHGPRARAEVDGKALLISHERLSGYAPAGARDVREVAARLHMVLPDARIVLVLREQRSMMRALYGQYIQDGGSSSFRTFLAPSDRSVVRLPHFHVDQLRYSRLIDMYRDLFAPDQVYVAAVELLGSNPDAFLQRWPWQMHGAAPALLTRVENPSRPATYTAILRWINQVVVRNQLNPGGLVDVPWLPKALERTAPVLGRGPLGPVASAIDARHRRELAELVPEGLFTDDNRRTADLTGLSLATLGYE